MAVVVGESGEGRTCEVGAAASCNSGPCGCYQ